MLGLAASLQKGGASLLTFVKDNLKLYLDFKSSKSDTLKFPSEGSTEFDGSDDFIDCGDINDVDGASALSISAWVKFNNTSDSQAIVSKYSSSTLRLEFILSSNTLFAVVANGNTMEGSFSYTSTDWNHVTMVFNGSGTGNAGRLKVYLNGVSQTLSYSGTIGTSIADLGTNSFKIGNRTSHHFNGKIANIGLWSRALEPEEVQSIMNKSYSQLKGVEKTSLEAWWALDNAVLGDELITDGDFLSSDNWNPGTGWTIDTTQGKAIHIDDGNGGFRFLSYTDATLNPLAEYQITITIDSASDLTGCGFVLGGSVRTFSPGHLNSTGTNTFSVIIGTTGLTLWCASNSVTISNISIKEKNVHTDSKGSNNGVNIGATTTTSVYGGNAPILPRAVDVAKEGQADNIGDGSALFNGSSDHVEIGNTFQSVFQSAFTITAWIKPDDGQPSGINALFGSDSTSDQDRFRIMLKTDGKIGLLYKTDNNNNGEIDSDTTNAVFSNGATDWTHIAVTMSQSGTTVTGIVYVNGIAVAGSFSGSHASLSMADFATTTNFAIGGANRAGSLTQHFDGFISQVGLWQGSLTQSQIQSVMEATSYSKIPSSVKSTLGSDELPSPDLTSGTGLTITQGSTGTLTHDTTAGTITATNDVQDGYLRWFSAGLEENKLYKLEIVVDSYTGGRFRTTLGWNGTNFYPSVGTNIQYFIGSSTASFGIRIDDGNPAEFVISKISVKEVTNDIVAYYPLDGSSSANGVTQDVTTGETLGAERVLNSDFSDGENLWTLNNANVVNGVLEIDEGAFSYYAQQSVDGGGSNYRQFESGYLMKLEIVVDEYTSGGTIIYATGNNIGTFSSAGTHTIYYKPSSNEYLRLRSNGSGFEGKISSVSIKRVTSNTGVLK